MSNNPKLFNLDHRELLRWTVRVIEGYSAALRNANEELEPATIPDVRRRVDTVAGGLDTLTATLAHHLELEQTQQTEEEKN